MNKFENAAVSSCLAEVSLKAADLITTLYVDVVLPRGGKISVRSLVDLLAPLNVNERLVRTVLFRLSKDGILQSVKNGRCSDYRLTSHATATFTRHSSVIYSRPEVRWDGKWSFVLLTPLQLPRRIEVQDALLDDGFIKLDAGFMASPSCSLARLKLSLQSLGVVEDVQAFSGVLSQREASSALRGVISSQWGFGELRLQHLDFYRLFDSLRKVLSDKPSLSSQDSFLLRLVLICKYRQLISSQPALPRELLPPDWQGEMSWDICRWLYRYVSELSEEWITRYAVTVDGELPLPDSLYLSRFGGCAS